MAIVKHTHRNADKVKGKQQVVKCDICGKIIRKGFPKSEKTRGAFGRQPYR